jgi:phosphoglycolate phosphatase-like HAD superfamily hydrolase
MKYNCIIFDCDGVLVDSEAISAKVFQEMILELGAEIDFETVLEQITGTSMKENLRFFSENIDGELPDDFETEFRKRSYEAFKTDLKPIKGIHDLLKKIKVPVGVASSGPVEKIRLNLTTTNLIHFLGKTFSVRTKFKAGNPILKSIYMQQKKWISNQVNVLLLKIVCREFRLQKQVVLMFSDLQVKRIKPPLKNREQLYFSMWMNLKAC